VVLVDVGLMKGGRNLISKGGGRSRKLYINWLKYGEPDNLEVAFLKLCHFGISAGIQLVMMLYARRL
jgi:hypothetical protein